MSKDKDKDKDTASKEAKPSTEKVEYSILTKSLRDAIVGELGKLPHHAVRGSIDALLNLPIQTQEVAKPEAVGSPVTEKKNDAKEKDIKNTGDKATEESQK